MTATRATSEKIAITIQWALAVVLSVFNAVTFTPALSALLLMSGAHSTHGFWGPVNYVIDGGLVKTM